MFTVQTRNATGVWQRAPDPGGVYETLGDALHALASVKALWPTGTFRIVHKPT